MARFRAYETDSEEDSSSSDESVQAERRLSDAGPFTEHAIRPASESPSESEDIHAQDQQEDDDDDIESVISNSPPLETNRLPDPSLTPWARHVGVDRQKMQVMQATLFRAPEEEAAMQEISRQQPLRKQIMPALGRKHSRDSDGEGLRADSRQVRLLHSHGTLLHCWPIASFVCT
jgi:nuclear pore complex protein Nup98-Nup96